MVAYNFQTRFAPAVESGEKTTTFRVLGKRRHARPGEMLQLYTGMRQKGCRLLRTVPCRAALPLVIDRHGMVLGGSRLTAGEVDALAKSDGFASGEDMIQWVKDTHGVPAEGVLIEWAGPAGER